MKKKKKTFEKTFWASGWYKVF